jgi:hypothetical protein
MPLKYFSYQFDAGPLETKEELDGDWKTGNCRRALQYYFYATRGLFLLPKEVLCPEAYYQTGEFVFKKGDIVELSKLQPGDIIYAERIRSKDGSPINKSEESFPTADDYIVALHTAIYVGEQDKEIWHATSIEGGSCQWPLAKFLKFYKPIAIKRLF